MSHRILARSLVALVGLATLSLTGCPSAGPQLGILAYPIPVSPYLQKKKEDRHWQHERYDRVPILGPLPAGGPAVALDPPSDDEVMRAMEEIHPVARGIPYIFESQRSNVRIVKDLVADYVDPVRVYPLIGPAQQHHAQYKCTVYYTQRERVGWPIPHTLTDEDSVEVVYIDHNHLHMVGNVDTGVGSNY